MAEYKSKTMSTKKDASAEKGQPGDGKNRVDDVGVIPEGIRIDPNITEGHPGYDESGDSELHPPIGGTAPRQGTPS
jgi:hypothetical protein